MNASRGPAVRNSAPQATILANGGYQTHGGRALRRGNGELRHGPRPAGPGLRSGSGQASGPPPRNPPRSLAELRTFRGSMLAEDLGLSRRSQYMHVSGHPTESEGSDLRGSRRSRHVSSRGRPAVPRRAADTGTSLDVDSKTQATRQAGHPPVSG